MSTVFTLFVTGHKGFETLLFHELRQILQQQDAQINKQYGGIEVLGGLEAAYRICLHSRLANRVFCQLKEFKVEDDEQLYQQVYALDWSEHLGSRNSFAVSATLSRSNLDHTHFASLRVKDAIVDQFRERFDSRPVIEKQQPDIHIHLNVHRNQAKLSLDLSGESLHRRGYRTEHAGAPLKEHLAAAMIVNAGWNREIARSHRFVDPMCGSGTFAIEAAMIAANIAPGMDRAYYGFSKWAQHDVALWQSCVQQAEDQIERAPALKIFASDYDANAIRVARENAARAGVEDLIQFLHQDIRDLKLDPVPGPTLVLCNPPYGERLQSEQGLAALYGDIGQSMKRLTPATLHMISANPDLMHRLRLTRLDKKPVKNGPIDCLLASFAISASDTTATAPAAVATPKGATEDAEPPVSAIRAHKVESVTPLLNRLAKNAKHLKRWAKRNDITCYRLYDADLPEFSFALDLYQSELEPSLCWYHMQEYAAPKIIDADKAEARIELAKQAVKQVFKLDDKQLFCKTRTRQRGSKQYQKQDSQGELFQVREAGASLLINLSDYLDSGLFLDHRSTRQHVCRLARDKSVLNLFCYTGSVSIQAALGGASRVTSVDMSATYLKWAQENLAINGFEDAAKYPMLRADVVEMLENPQRFEIATEYDLIFLDPPSFSNSSKMMETLDIQRDHEQLIRRSMQLLSPQGLLIFSCNRKGFKINPALLTEFELKDISHETIPEDFKRKPGIHKCWEIRYQHAS